MTSSVKKGIIKRIHVVQPNIRANKKDGGNRPVISVRTSAKIYRGSAVKINGPSALVYRPDRPLSCGARLWIETKSEVVIDE